MCRSGTHSVSGKAGGGLRSDVVVTAFRTPRSERIVPRPVASRHGVAGGAQRYGSVPSGAVRHWGLGGPQPQGRGAAAPYRPTRDGVGDRPGPLPFRRRETGDGGLLRNCRHALLRRVRG